MAADNPSAQPTRQKTWFESLFGGASVKPVQSTVRFTPTKSVSMPSAGSSSVPGLSVPFVQSNSLLRHTATPVVVAPRTSSTMQGSSGGKMSAFGSLSTDRLKRTSSVSGGGFSGGASAGGLMNSGSRYASGSAGGGSITGSSVAITSGPRRDPKDPLLDEEEEEETPLGDMMWPMMLLALAYLIYSYTRARVRRLNR